MQSWAQDQRVSFGQNQDSSQQRDDRQGEQTQPSKNLVQASQRCLPFGRGTLPFTASFNKSLLCLGLLSVPPGVSPPHLTGPYSCELGEDIWQTGRLPEHTSASWAPLTDVQFLLHRHRLSSGLAEHRSRKCHSAPGLFQPPASAPASTSSRLFEPQTPRPGPPSFSALGHCLQRGDDDCACSVPGMRDGWRAGWAQ